MNSVLSVVLAALGYRTKSIGDSMTTVNIHKAKVRSIGCSWLK
jgi:hypothetical protein